MPSFPSVACVCRLPPSSAPCRLKFNHYQGASPLFLPQAWPCLPCCSQQMPPSQDPQHKELAVSQVLLILIGSGMTYCRGEGDCHGPTGMGAGGIQGQRRGNVCLCVCVHACVCMCVSMCMCMRVCVCISSQNRAQMWREISSRDEKMKTV